ncbi:YbaB/EbfC DNA-binding family protein [Frankia sp. AiPs1]|uniref:YbaB/EbfC family nucleoid-associated protein n=1 Tax=Frankia sp. AiPa1 TaxID=573492 RepID=UPI00202B9221|nr:YbaB/EbfC family nucleoid-associated protein [Frankia sp. AiPa1]MCL9762487.1 YbaB/EbfC family nucleoid-associated protein [Frankia sp. AiPa1]
MAMFDDSFMESALAELARTEEITARIRTEGAEVSFQATDRNKLLSVTVGGQGEIRELRFRGDAYRELAPAELADLLVKTFEQARQGARARALAGMQELMRGLPPIGRLADMASIDELVDELTGMFVRNMPDDGQPPVPPAEPGAWR